MAVIGFVICFLALGYTTFSLCFMFYFEYLFSGLSKYGIAIFIFLFSLLMVWWYLLFKFAPFTLETVQ